MLSRLLAVALAALLLTANALAADSDFGAEGHKDGSATVTVSASDSATSNRGGGSGNAGAGGCFRDDGQRVACSSELGWWSAAYDCYLQLVSEAAPDDPLHAGEGQFRCDPGPLGWGAGPAQIFMWLPMAAAGPDPEVLAQQALDSMQLRGIAIGTAPPPGTQALVNTPVLLWVDQPGAATWGPVSATAAAGGVSVTATARATSVRWDMGDGSTVICGKGAAYGSAADPSEAPCSHTYRRAGQWQITATTSWQVDWQASTGRSGGTAVQTQSSVALDVREARALIVERG